MTWFCVSAYLRSMATQLLMSFFRGAACAFMIGAALCPTLMLAGRRWTFACAMRMRFDDVGRTPVLCRHLVRPQLMKGQQGAVPFDFLQGERCHSVPIHPIIADRLFQPCCSRRTSALLAERLDAPAHPALCSL